MKRNRLTLTIVSILLLFAISVSICSCASAPSKDLMDGVTPNEVTPSADLTQGNAAVTDFAIKLFQATNEDGKNTLISPLSVLCALSMSANGAKGETLAEMETVLGMTADELNVYLYSYMNALPQSETSKLSLANSVWFTDDARFTVDRDFLQTTADYYGADVYQVPFDTPTSEKMNEWVNEHTDGMIPHAVDDLPEDAVMLLVNALAFDAEWTEAYSEEQVKSRPFYGQDGAVQNAEMMHGTEHLYLEDENATGFIKYYKGRKYAFVALLPHASISISDYVDSLDGASLHALLTDPTQAVVSTAIPKFETSYDVEMSDILADMGMPLAFDPSQADLTGLGRYVGENVFISSVFHKTVISVGEKGTRAGAVTVVVDSPTSADDIEPKRVYLDRPFVYMLIDCENSVPFFIGTVTELGE